MEANAGEYIKNYLHLKRFPRISLHCKLVPVQYSEYEYGLLANIGIVAMTFLLFPKAKENYQFYQVCFFAAKRCWVSSTERVQVVYKC
mgnify:CR=1 FL=1